jgi:two-component system, cell cycle response regulator
MKVLVAEDHPVTRKMLAIKLGQWGYEVILCADGIEAWRALNEEDSPSLVIMDWMMPGMDGVQVCREIRKLGLQKYVYIILLTAKNRAEDIVLGLEAGADDYIVKPFDPQELRVRVRAGSRVVQLQQDLLAALKASEFQATHDPLTRLWNRAAIVDIFGRELARTRRESRSLAAVMTDVDHFKRVNDEYGHLAGDAVLREVGRRLLAGVRPYDSVGRYGGEEFLLVLPGANGGGAEGLAERLRLMFDGEPMSTPEGVFNVTMSFGVALFDPSEAENVEDLVRKADAALYRAKHFGRNRVESWHPERSEP